MRSKIKAVAAIVAATGFAISPPATADHQEHEYGEHTGSVAFAETVGDAAKRVDLDRRRAPRANVDLKRSQFTQTDGLLTLDLELRTMTPTTVDRLLVDFDTDGDARADQRLTWSRGGAPAMTGLSEGYGACTDVDVQLNYELDLIHIVVDRDCLPVIQRYEPAIAGSDGQQPGHAAVPEIHANVAHLRATVHDDIGKSNAKGEFVHGTWDFIGGRHSMLAIPF